MADNALILAPPKPDLYMPAASLEQAGQRLGQFKAFVKSQMKEGVDYTSAKGGQKPALTKAGAEKLGTFFGHKAKFHEDEKIQDWTGEAHGGQPLFAYTFTCSLERDGYYLGQASGHCNTWESRYRWRWMPPDQIPPNVPLGDLYKREAILEEFLFAIEKKETMPPYGKPMEHWQGFERAIQNKTAEYFHKKTQSGKELPAARVVGIQYRVPNPDPYDGVNTALKIAQKRALVAAELIVCNASDFFTQDLDDDPHAPWDNPVAPPPPAARSSQSRSPSSPATHPPEAPPEAPADDVPEPVRKIWARMAKGTREQRIAEFQGLKKALMEARGDDEGQACYYSILGTHRVQHANQFKDLSAARKAILQLWNALQASLGEGANEPPESEGIEPDGID